MATRIYKTPFAATGDKEVLATADQPDGKVSLQAGWTPDYELPNDNANYRPVGRAEMNGILSEVTEGLGEMQLNGFATWQDIDGGWPMGAHVMADGIVYRSEVDNNVTNPASGGAGWDNPFSGRLINVRFYSTAGSFTYTPTAGTNSIIVLGIGGGGAGGGVPTAVSAAAAGGGGGGGAFGMKRVTAVPASVALTIGAAGVAASGANGGAGGTTSFGALLTVPGGMGGLVGNASATSGVSAGVPVASSSPSGQDIGSLGSSGSAGFIFSTSAIGGEGGGSHFGSGGPANPLTSGAVAAGRTAVSPGSGGGGAVGVNNGAAVAGGPGLPGVLIIWEYS